LTPKLVAIKSAGISKRPRIRIGKARFFI
jgi:hypothetical protein